MKQTMCLLALCVLLSGCISDGGENDAMTIVGKWEQTIHEGNERYCLDITSSRLKWYYYDTSGSIVYLINGSYDVKGENSISATDLESNQKKNYYYYLRDCNDLFFVDKTLGYIRIE